MGPGLDKGLPYERLLLEPCYVGSKMGDLTAGSSGLPVLQQERLSNCSQLHPVSTRTAGLKGSSGG